jgi:hypothetical protein
VVLSDINTSWIVPSIRGKVVGALHPQAFVPDQKQRFDDVNTFFDADNKVLSNSKSQSPKNTGLDFSVAE